MINGKAHDLSNKENAIFTNCLKIVTSATMHDAKFVVEGPVSLAQASPYAQRGHKDHAALWDTTPWREFVATTGNHRVVLACASPTMTKRRVRTPCPNARLDSRPTRRRTHTLF